MGLMTFWVILKKENNMILFEVHEQILFDDEELDDILVLDFEVLKIYLIVLIRDKLKALVQVLDLILIWKIYFDELLILIQIQNDIMTLFLQEKKQKLKKNLKLLILKKLMKFQFLI